MTVNFDWLNALRNEFEKHAKLDTIFSNKNFCYPNTNVPTLLEFRYLQLQRYFSNQYAFIINAEKKVSLEFILLRKATKLLNEKNDIKETLNKLINIKYSADEEIEILKILFSSSLIVLADQLCHLDLVDSETQLEDFSENTGNYMKLVNKLAQNFCAMLITYYQENKITDENKKNLMVFVKNIHSNTDKFIKLGDAILGLFRRLDLVKETTKTSKDKIINKIKTFREITLTTKGHSFFTHASKIDYVPYRKIPMIHEPFEIRDCCGDGFTKVEQGNDEKSFLESIIIEKNNGCKLEIINKRRIDNLLNQLIKKPLRVNINLFKCYLANYTMSTERTTKSLLEKFLVDPIEQGYDKTRLNYILQRFLFFIFLPNVAFGYDRKEREENLKEYFDIVENNLLLYSSIRLDSRGRLYYLANAFIQNAKFERSLFKLPQIIPLENPLSVEALINSIVTLYGYDIENKNIKLLSWNNKINFFFSNLTLFSSFICIRKAKEPYLFTSLYFELVNQNVFNEENFNRDYLKTLALSSGVFVDNTASGAQILTLLVACLSIANKLNLKIQSYDDPIDDLYEHFSALCNKNLKSYFLGQTEIIDYLEKIQFVFTRKLVKEPVMSSFYGISFQKIARNILNYLNSLDNSVTLQVITQLKNKYKTQYKSKISYKEYISTILTLDEQQLFIKHKQDSDIRFKVSLKLATFLRKTIRTELSAIFEFFDLIKSYIQELNNINISFRWKPLTEDLAITQTYTKVEIKKILLPYRFSKKIRRYSKIRVPTQLVNKKKNLQAVMANLIHSFDSALLREVLFNCNPLVEKVIHDSYYISPNNYSEFMLKYKEAFITFFREKNIDIFLESIKIDISNKTFLLAPEKTKVKIQNAYLKLYNYLKDETRMRNREKLLEQVSQSKYILYF